MKTPLGENLLSEYLGYVLYTSLGLLHLFIQSVLSKSILVSHLPGKLPVSASITQLEFSAQIYHFLPLKQVIPVFPTKLPELTN